MAARRVVYAASVGGSNSNIVLLQTPNSLFLSGSSPSFLGIHIDIYKMRKSAANEKILSYNDAVLRRSDLDILSGPYFLNYCIIEFYFSYLPSCYPSEEFVLVSSSIAFWIANCPDIESFKDFVEPLNLSSKKLVIFPVNNNDDVTEAEGGNRWSLLVFERNANVSVHHDSYGGLNAGHAKQLYRAIVGYMGILIWHQLVNMLCALKPHSK